MLSAPEPCPVPARAELELGDVTLAKLKSYRQYFRPYLEVRSPIFADTEFEQKIIQEARDIHAWLADAASWKRAGGDSDELNAESCWLFLYFDNIGIEGAGNEALKQWDSLDPRDATKDPALIGELVQLARRLGDRDKMIALIKQVMILDPALAEKLNFNYVLAVDYYDQGLFALAYEAMKNQSAIDPEFENGSNMLLAMNLWIEAWGHIPERVRFETTEDGHTKIPTPLD